MPLTSESIQPTFLAFASTTIALTRYIPRVWRCIVSFSKLALLACSLIHNMGLQIGWELSFFRGPLWFLNYVSLMSLLMFPLPLRFCLSPFQFSHAPSFVFIRFAWWPSPHCLAALSLWVLKKSLPKRVLEGVELANSLLKTNWIWFDVCGRWSQHSVDLPPLGLPSPKRCRWPFI